MGRSVLARGLALIGSAAALATPALADRDMTTRIRFEVVETVREMGFDDWELIKVEDGIWNFVNARQWGRRRYDLKVDPVTFLIIKRQRDN